MHTQKNKQVVKNVYAAFGRKNIAAVLALLAEDVIWHLPGTVPRYSGSYKNPSSVAICFKSFVLRGGRSLRTR